ncbi:MAG: thiamine-phosphate diphosphorylase [Desulfuromonadales bacterium GWD2_61_12]|nr:MAG: thiamine-phosphate diphosphorylase [Desulfuromonadales bacterium GWC2_61_20]OGR36557.1 MAG: thiamine-phosphate diphosphorylase [Desulfuromonadales bacterium GWD2_61_12]HAD05036.1 thiamine phosphate synthase [Desulfuromonas sp.]HBT83315.1 thiamine phosphate synthase [Desulfuromonas sp.]
MPSVDFSLYLITDRHQLPAGRTLGETVRAALEGGVRAVQLREKDLAAAELYPLARELRALTRAFGAKLLVNDRVDIALAVEADGVHLGGHSLPIAVCRTLLGPDKLLGVSTHRLGEIDAAAGAGADFVTFGPVYPTPTKLPFGPPLGPEALAAACATTPLPLFALGGIGKEQLPPLRLSGCCRVAVISAILTAPDPRSSASTLLRLLAD